MAARKGRRIWRTALLHVVLVRGDHLCVRWHLLGNQRNDGAAYFVSRLDRLQRDRISWPGILPQPSAAPNRSGQSDGMVRSAGSCGWGHDRDNVYRRFRASLPELGVRARCHLLTGALCLGGGVYLGGAAPQPLRECADGPDVDHGATYAGVTRLLKRVSLSLSEVSHTLCSSRRL